MAPRRNLILAAALVFVACLVQVWTIARAVVPAQDCVRYLVVAQGFERDGVTATLRAQPEQPLFPALVWVVHDTLSAVGWIDTANWAACLQIAAAIGLVLSVVPVYLLFQRLHGDRAAVVATLIYCLLGGVSRLGADGLSDSTHLALFVTGLWCAARYFDSCAINVGSPAWLLACGLCTGLALTARCESLVLPVALLATLGFWACVKPSGRAWKRAAMGTASFSLGLTMVLAPYLAWCAALTPETALARLAGRAGAAEAAPLNDFRPGAGADTTEPRWELPGLGRLVFGKKDTSSSSRFHGYLSAAGKLLHELAQTLHYWLGALALIGLAGRWRRLATPLDRFMQCLCATLIAAGIWVAARAGYLSTRHVLLLVVLAIGWAGYGIVLLSDWLTRLPVERASRLLTSGPASEQARRLFYGIRWRLPVERASRLLTSGPASEQARRLFYGFRPHTLFSAVLAAACVAACGADCTAPLHASRAAHRQAADWLTSHTTPSAAVLDSRGWTALYTGRKTYRYEAAQAAFSDPALCYVVVEQAELSADSRRSETMRLLLNHAGEPAAQFTAADSDKHRVVVYHWRPERFHQLGVQTYAR